jgi:hypothetical protein
MIKQSIGGLFVNPFMVSFGHYFVIVNESLKWVNRPNGLGRKA